MVKNAVKMRFFCLILKISANFFPDVSSRNGTNHFSHKYNNMAMKKYKKIDFKTTHVIHNGG